jgi:uncharacterized protein YndB with AHSA1/START domain
VRAAAVDTAPLLKGFAAGLMWNGSEAMLMSAGESVVEREIFIAASPETVFEFFSDPALMGLWIGRWHVLDARPGGQFRIEISSGNVANGCYTVVDPPRRIAFTWGWETQSFAQGNLEPGASLVEINLEPKDGGTLVRLRHSGLPDSMSDMHDDHWAGYLQQLRIAASRKISHER